jgi:outer membrane protein TolC
MKNLGKPLFLLWALAAVAQAPVPLSLKRAVEMALAPEGNTRLQLAEEAVRLAQAQAAQARAALLPELEGTLGAQSRTTNLAAAGVQLNIPVPGFTFREFVGPFPVYDARLTVRQSLVDVSLLRRHQASRIGAAAAQSETESVKDQTAALVARLYLTALRADAAAEAAQANVTLAESLLRLAQDRAEAGKGTALEVTRAQVQLANERQRLLGADIERNRARRALLRAMDMPLDLVVDLTDKLLYRPADPPSVAQALEIARQSRADLRAQQQREDSARWNRRAADSERLPTVTGFGDYGSLGIGFDRLLPTRTVGVAVRVPLFDAGREARRAESLAVLRQENIRRRELGEQIELEVRQALDSLRVAEQQVQVAEDGLRLAEEELAQARRRYEAGLTNSVEVTGAQTRLARARDNHVAALFGFQGARIDLGEAMGTIRNLILE